ncbi:MAG: c-type cytochrome [Chloroflexi bacterium]|nr:c-type cytochrome [Chloroflexota bacterium]
MRRRFTIWAAALAGTAVLILTGILFGEHTAYALPEYAQRTNESCATCHVNPGGGGPRTMRGLIWAAKGKPDAVPELPGVLLAPGVSNGEELYQIACSSCHGVYGEGMFGAALLFSGVPENKIRSNIARGRIRSGMPSFDGKFTPEQLDALVAFVSTLASGEATPAPNSYPLDSPRFQGAPQSTPMPSGGN